MLLKFRSLQIVLFGLALILFAPNFCFGQDEEPKDDLKKLACEIHKKVKGGKIAKDMTTILVARVKVDGEPKTIITTNPGSGGNKNGVTGPGIKAKCKELKEQNPKGDDETQEEYDEKIKNLKLAWIKETQKGSKGGWRPELSKCFADWKGKGHCVIEDLSKHKYDHCAGPLGKKWPHAEDTLKCWIKLEKEKADVTEVEVCELGICRGENSDKPDMCWKCYCDFGPDGENWPRPQCVTDEMLDKTVCEIMQKKNLDEKPEKSKVKIQNASRDGGDNFEDCTVFKVFEVTFDVAVTVEPDAFSVVDSSGNFIATELVCVEEAFVSLEIMEDLPPGEYTVQIDPEKVRSVFLECPLEIEPAASSSIAAPVRACMTEVVAIEGDINQDMEVGISDVIEFIPHWIDPAPAPQWSEGDFNNDDQVNIFDALALLSNYGQVY